MVFTHKRVAKEACLSANTNTEALRTNGKRQGVILAYVIICILFRLLTPGLWLLDWHLRIGQPIERLLLRLHPDDFVWSRVASEPRHPRHGHSVFFLHPVGHAWLNHHFMHVAVFVLLMQMSQQFLPFDCMLIAFVSLV